MEHIFILFIIFFGVSYIFSMIGMGGGILYVPILLFAGYTIKQAPAISLILILATSLAAITTFLKNKKIDFKLAFIIEPATNIMAFMGGFYSNLIPEIVLKVLLILVLITAGIFMSRKFTKKILQQQDKKCFWLWHRNFNDTN